MPQYYKLCVEIIIQLNTPGILGTSCSGGRHSARSPIRKLLCTPAALRFAVVICDSFRLSGPQLDFFLAYIQSVQNKIEEKSFFFEKSFIRV